MVDKAGSELAKSSVAEAVVDTRAADEGAALGSNIVGTLGAISGGNLDGLVKSILADLELQASNGQIPAASQNAALQIIADLRSQIDKSTETALQTAAQKAVEAGVLTREQAAKYLGEEARNEAAPAKPEASPLAAVLEQAKAEAEKTAEQPKAAPVVGPATQTLAEERAKASEAPKAMAL